MKHLDFDLLKDYLTQGKPGFQNFRYNGNNQYYFKYSNDLGDALILSHPHLSSQKRDQALKRVEKYLANPERYKPVPEGESSYFSIQAGNHQEFALSIPFSSEEEMLDQMSLVQQQFGIIRETGQGQQIEWKKLDKLVDSKQEPQPTRFKFDLIFYQQSAGEPLIGKIEYPLEKEKTTFEGLDLEIIGHFIAGRLPAAPAKTKVTAEEVREKPQPTSVEPVSFQLLTQELPIDGNKLHLNQKAMLQLSLSAQETNNGQLGFFEASATARAFSGNSRSILVGNYKGPVLPDGKVMIPLKIIQLPPGIYQFSFNAKLFSPDHPAADRLIMGRRTIQLLEPWLEKIR